MKLIEWKKETDSLCENLLTDEQAERLLNAIIPGHLQFDNSSEKFEDSLRNEYVKTAWKVAKVYAPLRRLLPWYMVIVGQSESSWTALVGQNNSAIDGQGLFQSTDLEFKKLRSSVIEKWRLNKQSLKYPISQLNLNLVQFELDYWSRVSKKDNSKADPFSNGIVNNQAVPGKWEHTKQGLLCRPNPYLVQSSGKNVRIAPVVFMTYIRPQSGQKSNVTPEHIWTTHFLITFVIDNIARSCVTEQDKTDMIAVISKLLRYVPTPSMDYALSASVWATLNKDLNKNYRSMFRNTPTAVEVFNMLSERWMKLKGRLPSKMDEYEIWNNSGFYTSQFWMTLEDWSVKGVPIKTSNADLDNNWNATLGDNFGDNPEIRRKKKRYSQYQTVYASFMNEKLKWDNNAFIYDENNIKSDDEARLETAKRIVNSVKSVANGTALATTSRIYRSKRYDNVKDTLGEALAKLDPKQLDDVMQSLSGFLQGEVQYVVNEIPLMNITSITVSKQDPPIAVIKTESQTYEVPLIKLLSAVKDRAEIEVPKFKELFSEHIPSPSVVFAGILGTDENGRPLQNGTPPTKQSSVSFSGIINDYKLKA